MVVSVVELHSSCCLYYKPLKPELRKRNPRTLEAQRVGSSQALLLPSHSYAAAVSPGDPDIAEDDDHHRGSEPGEDHLGAGHRPVRRPPASAAPGTRPAGGPCCRVRRRWRLGDAQQRPGGHRHHSRGVADDEDRQQEEPWRGRQGDAAAGRHWHSCEGGKPLSRSLTTEFCVRGVGIYIYIRRMPVRCNGTV